MHDHSAFAMVAAQDQGVAVLVIRDVTTISCVCVVTSNPKNATSWEVSRSYGDMEKGGEEVILGGFARRPMRHGSCEVSDVGDD